MDLCQSPHLAGKQMSSSLKERLKRSARFKTSPLLSKCDSLGDAKSPPQCQYDSEVSSSCCQLKNDQNYSQKSTLTHASSEISPLLPSIEEVEKCNDKQKLQEILLNLKVVHSQQEEKMRKLKMVQLYRSKNDPQTFEKLIEKWKLVTQEALKSLYDGLPEPKPSLGELINHFEIEHKLIGYNSEDESFT